MTRPPTVYDVAARAGVSIATVSRVLSRPDDVAAGTRARVAAAVDELGYVRNVSARGLAGSRTHVLGLLLPPHRDIEPALPERNDTTEVVDDRTSARRDPDSSENLYYDEVVRGAERAASAADHALLIAAGRAVDRERLLRDIAARVDGLVVVASSLEPTLIETVARRIPVVLLAGAADPAGLDRVSAANAEGMLALTRTLLADGRVRSIAYLDGPADAPDGRERRGGFAAALDGTGVEARYLSGEFSEVAGAAIAEAMLADGGIDGLPDAVVCANDQSALGVLESFRHAGVDVPGRVRVTGFDGVDAGRFSTPRLTTVRQPMAELGFAAIGMLLDRLRDPSAPPASRILPVDVLLRESAPPA